MTTTILAQVEGFTPIIDVVAQEVGLIGAAIYGTVWRYCQMKDGVCYASRETIGEKVGLSLSKVNKHLEDLCKLGYLEDLTPGLRNKPHTYRDAGKVIIQGAVEARIAKSDAMQETHTVKEVCEKNIPAMSEKHSHYVADTYEETIRDHKESSNDQKTNSLSLADFGTVQRAWEQSEGLLSKTTSDLLMEMCDTYGAPMVLEALLETVKQIGRPKIKYLEAVLQNWRDRGKDKRAVPKSQALPQIAPGVWRD